MNTLVSEPYPKALEGLLGKLKHRRHFFIYKNNEASYAFERGEIFEAEYFKNFYKEQVRPETLRLLPNPKKIKKALYSKINYLAGMKDLLESLIERKDVFIGIASNYSEWYEYILDALPLLRECHYLFFSCEMGIRKPDAAYYKLIWNALEEKEKEKNTTKELLAKDILFIDDREINLEVPREFCWQSHLIQNAYDVRKTIYKFLE